MAIKQPEICEVPPPSRPAVPTPPQPRPIAKPAVTPPPECAPPAPTTDPPRHWFADRMRGADPWNASVPPLPVTATAVEPYIDIQAYYQALGVEIRATRPELADFVYIAGWNVDLDAFVDPPGTQPRETLGTLLERAAKRQVEVRVLLPDQPHDGQDGAVARVAQLGGGAALDPFHKLVGTHHQKMVIIRNAGGLVGFCGGCDIENSRLGRGAVAAGAVASDGAQKSAPWHDVQVRIRGAAAADLWNSFIQRYREIVTRYVEFVYFTAGVPIPKAYPTMTVHKPVTLREPDDAHAAPRGAGLDVQVVRTYPNATKKHAGDDLMTFPRGPGYRFAPNGETGIYRLLVHAIGLTQRTIYLEDQYLVNVAAMAQLPPITDALRRAIEKPSFQKMIVLVAGTGTVAAELCQAGSRRADFIRQLGPAAGQKVACYYYGGDQNSPYWLHAKSWIFDDEFAVIGSANCNRRGYSHDSELGVGVADPERRTGGLHFAHRLRMNLWLKHLNAQKLEKGVGAKGSLTDADVRDFTAAAALWDKAPLLIRADFIKEAGPDLPAASHIAQTYPRAAKFLSGATTRDLDWLFIDPNGA